MEQFGERTEQATPRRRQEVRRKGQVARSTDLNAAVVLFGGTAVLLVVGPALGRSLGAIFQRCWGNAAWPSLRAGDVPRVFSAALESAAAGLGPFLLGVAVLAVLANLVQVGFLWSVEGVRPQLSRISPLRGLQRIFSVAGAVRLLVNVLKVGLVGALAGYWVWQEMPQLSATAALEPGQIAGYGWSSMLGLALKIGAVLAVLALVDYGFQRWRFEQEIRMTRHEVREELKETEGDPLLRHRRRQIQRQIAMQRTAAAVPKADVVVTNPTKLAVALRYKADEMEAPTVVAKGSGFVAERIREIAAEHKIPIVEQKPLAQALFRTVKVGQQIPSNFYQAVAEVLAYVYQIAGRKAA